MTEPKRIAIFAYRQWAQEAAHRIKHLTDDDERWTIDTYITRNSAERIAGSAPAALFALGWSWHIPASIVERVTGPTLIAHPSPLPRYRGGSPIQAQIIAGETVSALTLFEATENTDSGPIFWQRAFSLDGQLPVVLDRIIDRTVEGVMAALQAIDDGSYVATPQPDGNWAWNTRRKPESSQIAEVDMTGRELINLLRCLMLPYPPAYLLTSDGMRVPIKLEHRVGDADKAYRGEHL